MSANTKATPFLPKISALFTHDKNIHITCKCTFLSVLNIWIFEQSARLSPLETFTPTGMDESRASFAYALAVNDLFSTCEFRVCFFSFCFVSECWRVFWCFSVCLPLSFSDRPFLCPSFRVLPRNVNHISRLLFVSLLFQCHPEREAWTVYQNGTGVPFNRQLFSKNLQMTIVGDFCLKEPKIRHLFENISVFRWKNGIFIIHCIVFWSLVFRSHWNE